MFETKFEFGTTSMWILLTVKLSLSWRHLHCATYIQ